MKENEAKKLIFEAMVSMTNTMTLFAKALDAMGWIGDLLDYADELDAKSKNPSNAVEEVKQHLFDLTVQSLRKYFESREKEDAVMVFALYELADKLGWLAELEEKVKEDGQNVCFG